MSESGINPNLQNELVYSLSIVTLLLCIYIKSIHFMVPR
uniref:Uncharacterized protein n=1 Tax=Arundo donax TaxID=35708 RepID=A0A0A9HGM5_ARUDO